MSNTAKVLIGIFIAAIVGFAIWYFVYKKKSVVGPDGSPVLTAPPTATPPIQGISGLQSTENGAGKLAIDRRVQELLKSSVSTQLESETQSEIDILKGVTPSKVGYYAQNIAKPPILSARKIPLNLSGFQKSALQQFGLLNILDGANSANALRLANVELNNQIGTSFVGQNELTDTQYFSREVFCQGYLNCGKNYRDLPANIPAGAKLAGTDMQKMASTWLAGCEIFEGKLRLQAIEDLRAAGWKFQGFDF